MAFSSDEKQAILFHLGYPTRTLDNTSTHYSNIVDSRLNGLSLDGEDIVRSLLEQIESVKTKITASQDTMKVKRVGDIELNTDERSGLVSDSKRLYNELSSFLDIPYKGKSGINVGIRW